MSQPYLRIGVLGGLLLSCAGVGSKKHGAQSDVSPRLNAEFALLHEIWVGAKRPCISANPPQQDLATDLGRQWECEVPGWSSVMLTTGPEDGSVRALGADSDDPRRCELKRFAREAIVTEVIEAKILSEVTAALLSGPFAGTCVTLGIWYDRRRCDVWFFRPKDPRLFQSPSNPEWRRTACARR